ncbi:Nuclear distribution protein nudE-like 1-B, partial [Trichinella papuae]
LNCSCHVRKFHQNMSDIITLKNEVNHWKSVAESFKNNFATLKEEYNDFQAESRELEAELEAQLDQTEKKNSDLMRHNQQLKMECNGLRTKLECLQNENRKQVTMLEEELNRLRVERDELHRYVRELEQVNDHLERAHRSAIERNALLESELDEKDALRAHIQRLKEETRDLKQELDVKGRIEQTAYVKNSRMSESHIPNGDVKRVSLRKPLERSTSTGEVNRCSATTSRLTAFTILTDLWRRAGFYYISLNKVSFNGGVLVRVVVVVRVKERNQRSDLLYNLLLFVMAIELFTVEIGHIMCLILSYIVKYTIINYNKILR